MNKKHFIVDYISDGTIVGAHTHGLKDVGFNKLELEILLPITADLMLEFISAILDDGRIIDEDINDKTLLVNRVGSVRFKKMKPCFGSGIENEEVLRVIIPDENYKYPEDADCDMIYKFQGIDKVITLNHNKEFQKTCDSSCKKERNANSFFKRK